MKDAPRITSVVITLSDGRWQEFTAEEMDCVRDFALSKTWQLLEFITGLAPEPLKLEER